MQSIHEIRELTQSSIATLPYQTNYRQMYERMQKIPLLNFIRFKVVKDLLVEGQIKARHLKPEVLKLIKKIWGGDRHVAKMVTF